MKEVSTLGIDLAKNVFQVHGQDASGKKVLSKRLSRKKLGEFLAKLPKCIVAMEACGGANYWARKAQGYGHEVKVLAPQHVKGFTRGNKTDAKDAYAICEAAQRPEMETVRIKTLAQQEMQTISRLRERVKGNKVELVNQLRGALAEYGIVLPQGISTLKKRLSEGLEKGSERISRRLQAEFNELLVELIELEKRVERYTRLLEDYSENHEACKRLKTIPGIGPLTAVALVSAVGECETFKNGKKLSAWVGLTPHVSSSGEKCHVGKISKRGNVYLRSLLVHGARSYLQRVDSHEGKYAKWASGLKNRLGHVNKAIIALANKNARIACALLKHGGKFESEMACA